MDFARILVVDYGSQYTLLIAKAIRKLGVYSEVISEKQLVEKLNSSPVYGVILSGGPGSIPDLKPSPKTSPYQELIESDLPILGICYGAQLLAYLSGSPITQSETREYGETMIRCYDRNDPIYHKIPTDMMGDHPVWMSHSDTISNHVRQSGELEIISETEDELVAVFKIVYPNRKSPIYGLQFHPEVSHTPHGYTFFDNFLRICRVPRTWSTKSFLEQVIPELQRDIQDQKVLVACSGGVDSTVTALILQKAIGDRMIGVFVDNGLLRKNEFHQVLTIYRKLGLNVIGISASEDFYAVLKDVTDPEQKRKVIGNLFIKTFQDYINDYEPDIEFLGQGTIYPDVIESHGKIKSHHNVGGLPEKLNLALIEPLRELFKDEVREVGKELGLDPVILNRHPFPGPGLGIRILGDVTEEKVKMLQAADDIFIKSLKESGHYDYVWQAGAILLDSLSVGVMGDNRTYENVVALRAVVSINGMTAQVSNLPMEFLTKVSTEIVNKVQGINRVVYDITSKPPGTIEWE